jgi:Uma2 family endonuclease
LAPNERYEIIYGKAYCMAAPDAYHQSILMELTRQIANYLVGKPCKVYPAPFDVRLFYRRDEQDDTVVQPDITVVCDEKKRGPEGCRGAPDFVAEILSPSNSAGEMLCKFDLYREAGVKEYWVLDPKRKTLHVYRFDSGTAFPRVYRPGETAPVGIFAGLSIDLEAVFAE